MTSVKRREQPTLSKELNDPPKPDGKFEDIPTIPRVAGFSAGPRCKGKVVIVTGANSPLGIGRAAAHLFAQNEPKALFIADFNNSHLEVHARELKKLYPSVPVICREIDATDEEKVKQLCEEAIKSYGQLDIFFANAGIVSGSHIHDLEGDDFMEIMKGNLLSVFLCAKYASKAMLKTSDSKKYPGGSIICTASTAGIRSNAGDTPYSASKAGVVSICQTVAFQLAGTGIRINAICPGIIETGMTSLIYEAARAKGTERKIGQLNPLRRGGVADEVARVALFLGSDEASYVNGQAWAVDGGLSAGHPFVPGKMA